MIAIHCNRQEAIENDKVEAMICLPRNMSIVHDISSHYGFLNNNKKVSWHIESKRQNWRNPILDLRYVSNNI